MYENFSPADFQELPVILYLINFTGRAFYPVKAFLVALPVKISHVAHMQSVQTTSFSSFQYTMYIVHT